MTDDRQAALDLLRASGWLAPYGEAMAQALLAEGALRRLPAGRWAHGEGDEQTGVLAVIEGALDLYCQAPGDREVRIGHVGAGGALGQTMSFGGGPRLVTAVCAEPSLVLRVSDAGLERIARTQPDVWRAVATLVYLQLRNALQMAADAVALPPRQRLASRLLALSRNRRDRTLHLSQQALAEMTGLSRKTANAYLAQFQRQGLVSLDYARITVLDLAGLDRVAQAQGC